MSSLKVSRIKWRASLQASSAHAQTCKLICYSVDIVVRIFTCVFYKDNFSSFQAAGFCSLHRGVSGSTFYRSDIPFHHSSACWCADHFHLWTLSECTIISRKRMFKKKWSSPMAFLLCVNSWRNIFGWESWSMCCFFIFELMCYVFSQCGLLPSRRDSLWIKILERSVLLAVLPLFSKKMHLIWGDLA